MEHSITVGDKVDVGGCVGLITEINPRCVRVEGTYFYTDGCQGGESEPWNFLYGRHEFSKAKWNDSRWNAVDIEAVCKIHW